jgi:hypothetical protein
VTAQVTAQVDAAEVRRLRGAGLSQRAVAARLGVPRSAVVRVERAAVVLGGSGGTPAPAWLEAGDLAAAAAVPVAVAERGVGLGARPELGDGDRAGWRAWVEAALVDAGWWPASDWWAGVLADGAAAGVCVYRVGRRGGKSSSLCRRSRRAGFATPSSGRVLVR